MASFDDVDVSELISEVKERPVIWDRTLAEYRNKTVVQQAWMEICSHLKSDFEELEEDEKNEMIKLAYKKWVNIRDMWTKYYKKEIGKSKLPKNRRTYVHYNACMFLKKVFQETDESCNEDSEMNGSSPAEPTPAKRKRGDRSSTKKVSDTPRKQVPEEETLQDNEVYIRCGRHISFFKGILPAIAHLNENDTLEFQIGVLNVIKHLKSTRTPEPSVPGVFITSHEEVPVERMKREVSVESEGSSFKGEEEYTVEEEYLSEEFLDY